MKLVSRKEPNPDITWAEYGIKFTFDLNIRVAKRSWALPLAVTRGKNRIWVTVGPIHLDFPRRGSNA